MGQESSKDIGTRQEDEGSEISYQSQFSHVERDDHVPRGQLPESENFQNRPASQLDRERSVQNSVAGTSVPYATRINVEEAFNSAKLEEIIPARAVHETDRSRTQVSAKEANEIKEMNQKVLEKSLALSLHGMHWKSDWRGDKEQMCRMHGAEYIPYATDEFFVAKHNELREIYRVEVDQDLLTSKSTTQVVWRQHCNRCRRWSTE